MVVGYDPVSGKDALRLMPELRVTFAPYAALEGAHAAVLVTEWEEFRELDLECHHYRHVFQWVRMLKLLIRWSEAALSAILESESYWRNAGLLQSLTGFSRGMRAVEMLRHQWL